jgi:cell division protein FtsZ
MTLNLTVPQQAYTDFTPRITVIGVGGGGTNAVDNMIALNLQGVDFVVANTDAQQLMHSRADQRIRLAVHHRRHGRRHRHRCGARHRPHGP